MSRSSLIHRAAAGHAEVQRWLGVDFGDGAAAAWPARSCRRLPDPVRAAPRCALRVAVCLVRFGLLGFEYCACAEALAVTTPAAASRGAVRAALVPRR